MKRKLIYLLVFPVLLLSCKKYLDVKSDSSLSVPTTLEDMQALLDYTQNMNFFTVSHAEASTDNYFLTQGVYDSRGEKDKNTYIWKPSVSNFVGDWAKSYVAIYNSNLILEQIKNVPKTSVNQIQWNNVYGSAHFFRAYYFTQLVWTYAKAFDNATASTDLGIVIRLTSDQNITSVRSSVQQSYDQIIKDARESLNYLPPVAQIATRPSAAAANGLLARTYLSMRIYDSAFKYSDQSLAIRSELLDFNNTVDVDMNEQVPIKPFNREITLLTHMSNDFVTVNPYLAMVDTLLYNSYDNSDLRKQAFFYTDGGYQKFRGTHSGNLYTLFSGITTAEMILTRAECYAKNGETALALNDLNLLLVKRWDNTTFVPVTASNSIEALEKIREERRKELLFRGLRWIDIKRLNKDGANITLQRIISGQNYVLQPNDDKYALPLPRDIIQMTGIPQNPGW